MITITKNDSVSKVKNELKAKMVAEFMEFLISKYGEDAVALTRTSSKVNELAVIIDEVEYEGETNPVVCAINPVIKDFANRQTAKKTFTAYNFNESKTRYEDYLVEKAANAEKSKSKKNED